MKIMFHLTGLSKGGAERVVSNLSNYLIRHEEVIILVNTINNISYKLDKKIRIIELDKRNIKNTILRNYYRIKKTEKIVKNENPDVIIAFLPLPSYRILFLKNKLNCKVIISDRNNPKNEYKGILNKLLVKWLYKRADGFVFQTEEQKKYFNHIIQENSIVIPNPLANDFTNYEEKKKNNTIINVGRLVEQKNQELLIRAFKNASKNNNYILKIFGDGILKEKLDTLIHELGLSNRVLLCGVSDNIKLELEKAKIFVLSSNFEGMPNALMEAMACGLACISTDCPCGGPKELITNEVNGILIPTNNEEELEKAIDFLIQDDELIKKLGNEASKISERLDPKIINKKWEEYIQGVINND